MSVEVKSPVFPESVADGVIVTWHKKIGDSVEQDENLVDIETDKVVLEVPAPETGVLSAIHKNEGDTVTAQEILGLIKAGASSSNKKETEKEAESSQSVSASSEKEAEPSQSTNASSAKAGSEALVSPSAKKLIQQHSLSAVDIVGTGKDGRITKEDVQNFISSGQTKKDVAKSQSIPEVTQDAALRGERTEKRVPMSRLRARIAERLVQAQQTAAMLTTFNEVDLSEVKKIRAQYKEHFEKRHGVKLGFMSFFVKAAAEALKRFPAVNASIDGDDIVYHGYHDIGVAVSTERGLVVPILRNAELMSLADIEKRIVEFGQKARDGKLTMEEMAGGTFTISNGGVFGSLLSTPILNPPQSAILGMHSIQDRPVVVNGDITIRPMMNLAVSYDHRIIDGREAVSFLVAIKSFLEEPARLLLDI